MGPKKKLCSAERNQSEEVIISNTAVHSAEPVVQSNDEVPSMYLSLLPNEVLLHIYQYLSPVDLISLSKLEQRLNELTFSMREANFSSCRRISPDQVTSYFSRSRVKYIQKLNFNYNVFLKPSDLVKTICRCKNLLSLSIVQCGITHLHLNHILEACPKLEKLVWNAKEFSKTIDCKSSSLKRIYLVCDSYTMKNLLDPHERYPNVFAKFYKSFQSIEKIFIIFASDFLLGSPIMGMWFKTFCVTSDGLDCPKRQVFVVNCLYCFDKVRSVVNPPSVDYNEKDMDIEKRCLDHRLWDSPPFLAIRSTEKEISTVSSGSSDVYSSLLIYITPDDSYVAEKLADYISKVCGHKLNYLSLQCESLGPPNSKPSDISYVLEKTSLTCRNIKILDLTTVHFHTSPFKAICQLKNLEALCIPACAFAEYDIDKCPKGELISFQELVLSCPNVKNFVFINCFGGRYLSIDHLAPISSWKELRQLSIYNVTFHTYRFLRNIALYCKNMESFSFITAEGEQRCILVYDVIYLLQTAKNLSFIRINCETFNPMFERFWSTIGEASNLEGICIMTKHITYINKKELLQAIKKLQNLHVFHFSAPGISENLYTDVRKCMAGNGIINIKLGHGIISMYDELRKSQFYHRLPHFSCRDLHLNEIRF